VRVRGFFSGKSVIMKLCIVAVGASPIIEINSICGLKESGLSARLEGVKTHYVGSDTLSEAEWPGIFKSMYDSDFIILDTMGVPADFDEALTSGLAGYKGHVAVVNATSVAVRSMTRMGGFSLSMMKRMGKKGRAGDPARMLRIVERLERLGRALPVGPLRDMRNFFWISKYWLCGSRHNLTNMLYLIGREYFGCRDLPRPGPPVSIEDCSILDPASGRIFTSREAFYEAYPPDPAKPGLGLLFRAKPYPLNTHPVMADIMVCLSKSFNVMPVALDSTVGRNFSKMRNLFMHGGTPAIDMLVNPESFRLGQGPMGGDASKGVTFLQELDVPVLHPFFLTKRTSAQWRSDTKGAGTGEFLISIFLPELDGCIEMYPAAAVGTPQEQTPELSPITDRIERLSRRACNWVKLRKKPNREKRIAVLFYNYPPSAENAGSSAFLDTFASIAALLAKLAAEGYDTKPLTAEELKNIFIGQGRLNREGRAYPDQDSVTIDAKKYDRLMQAVPGRRLIDTHWGEFPGSVMTDGRLLALPGMMNGNVFIGVQPPRTAAGNADASCHDKHMPPHHQYAAFYCWLEQDFKADAVIHVGTHGTLEFLPGKEQALSGGCFPDALIGALPNIYVYYSGNSSEAMIARRRSHAVIIGHMPPPFTMGGLYGDLQAVKMLVDEYAEALNLNPGRCPDILDDIKKRTDALGWQWTDTDGLHRRLSDMQTALIPARLHTLGRGYSEEEAAAFLSQLFRLESAGGSGLYALLAARRGLNLQGPAAPEQNHSHELAEVARAARKWIEAHIISGEALAGHAEEAALVRRGEAIVKALMHNSELDEIVRALSGRYIAPGQSGDLFRCPEILPTGRNLVQFDPRAVPSPSALHLGAQIARNTIDRFLREHGCCPRSTAVILWGLETSQTQGETVGQILSYLGVRVVRESGQWLPRLALIPSGELERPRIDVTVQICGFFRDMFPNVLSMLQEAFCLAAFADEGDDRNFVRAHARLLFGELRGQGMEEADARELSLARIFGPASSEYGTSVEQLVNSRSWTTEGELVGAYIESLKHVYTPNRYGVEMAGLLNGNLRRVDVVSQVRSSRDYEITDLDHYYAFFGGLSRSVEQAAGKRAMMCVSDTNDGGVRTEDIADAVHRGVYSRLVNPAWLGGMLAHDHHGGHEIAKRLENLVGLAATTRAVGTETFDQVNRSLVFDEEVRQRIQHNIPYAMLDIVKRLWEANSRGYWQPDGQTLDRLKEIYLGLETHVEGLQQ